MVKLTNFCFVTTCASSSFSLTCLYHYFIQLHKELEELRERNKTLEEVAGQAEYFASLYQV